MTTPSIWARWLLGMLACVVSASTLAAAHDYNLPAMGQPSDVYLSPAKETKLGRKIVAQLLERGLVIEDIQLGTYLNRVGRRLTRHTSRDPNDFRFYVINKDQINAFALPGGYIGVNSGLITATDNESELAGVMAHEIAHVTQRHIARQIEATSGMGWATMAAILLAAIAGGGGDATTAAVTAGLSHLGQQQINYTRAHEFEADRVGIRTLARSGYDPDAMASFFKKLQRRSRLYGKQLPQILLTHPVSNTRMAEAESRAQDYPAHESHESAAYPLMKERARVLSHRHLSDLRRWYKKKRKGPDSDPALDYGYALVLMRLGQIQQALKLLQPLAKAHPRQPAYPLAIAQAKSQAGDLAAARTLLDDLRQRFPHSVAAKLDYAQALVAAGDEQAARAYLLSHDELTDHIPDAQQLLARAAGKQNRLGEAYYRQARYYQMRGAYPRAINQLRTALQTADLGGFDKSRLRALLKQMVLACHAALSAGECRQRVRADAQR